MQPRYLVFFKILESYSPHFYKSDFMKKLIYLFLGLLIVAFTNDNNYFYETN